MALSDELERTKLRFLQVGEELTKNGKLTEEEFEDILELLDSLDGLEEKEVLAALRELVGREAVLRLQRQLDILDIG